VGVKYKLFAIDLDGTLLTPSGVVSVRTKDAAQALVRAGARVCFATGRNFTESRAVIESVGHLDAAVFVGGALVYDTARRVTLKRTLMHPELARELAKFFESHGHAALALQDTHTTGVDYLASQEFDLHGDTERWLKATQSKLRRVAQLADYPHEHTMRVSIVTSRERGTRVRGELNKAFGDRIVSHNFTSMFNDISVVEAFDPTVNKWQGVIHVAGMHGINPAEIVAAGDDVNDVPMIRNAGLGVAMGNASDEVKQSAKRVIGKNSEDGLAEFFEEMLLAN
jgi:Cof subfamily protein (haloacid dehalogenase superfamily)